MDTLPKQVSGCSNFAFSAQVSYWATVIVVSRSHTPHTHMFDFFGGWDSGIGSCIHWDLCGPTMANFPCIAELWFNSVLYAIFFMIQRLHLAILKWPSQAVCTAQGVWPMCGNAASSTPPPKAFTGDWYNKTLSLIQAPIILPHGSGLYRGLIQ